MEERLQKTHGRVKHDKTHADGHEERAARILHIARQVEKPLRMRIGDGKERIDDIGQRDRHDAAQDHALRRGAVDEHILVAHPHRRQQRHTGHIERHRILIHPPLGALIHRKRGNDINDHIDDAEQQHNEEGIPLPVPLAGALRALLDEHDEENRQCKIVGLYVPHKRFLPFLPFLSRSAPSLRLRQSSYIIPVISILS